MKSSKEPDNDVNFVVRKRVKLLYMLITSFLAQQVASMSLATSKSYELHVIQTNVLRIILTLGVFWTLTKAGQMIVYFLVAPQIGWWRKMDYVLR